MQTEWTAAKIAMLQTMWEAGDNGVVIGRKLGCGRKAVARQARRLGLERRTERTRAATVRPLEPARTGLGPARSLAAGVELGETPKAVLAPLQGRLAGSETTTDETIAPTTVTIMELTDITCHWPIDSVSVELHYCGALVSGGSYCKLHNNMAYVPSRKDEYLGRR